MNLFFNMSIYLGLFLIKIHATGQYDIPEDFESLVNAWARSYSNTHVNTYVYDTVTLSERDVVLNIKDYLVNFRHSATREADLKESKLCLLDIIRQHRRDIGEAGLV